MVKTIHSSIDFSEIKETLHGPHDPRSSMEVVQQGVAGGYQTEAGQEAQVDVEGGSDRKSAADNVGNSEESPIQLINTPQVYIWLFFAF